MTAKKSNRGRKSKYHTNVLPYLDDVAKWANEGITDAVIAKNLGVSVATFCDYKNKFPELVEAIKKGRSPLISRVRGALIKRAEGFHYEEKKTYSKKDDETGNVVSYVEIMQKYCPPDVAAINLFLKNYDKDDWSNDPQNLELRRMELELRKKIAEEKAW